MDGQSDGAALVGDRARHCLTDPPGRVRRKFVAHLVIELLDRADQAEIPFLDEVEQRHAAVHVVACDRHDEAEVALDETALGRFVSLVLQAGKFAFFCGGQERAVADLADVELERILGLDDFASSNRLVVVLFLLGVGLVEQRRIGKIGRKLEARSLVRVVERSLWNPLFHEVDIGGATGPLNALLVLKSEGPAAERRGIVENRRSGVPGARTPSRLTQGASKHYPCAESLDIA